MKVLPHPIAILLSALLAAALLVPAFACATQQPAPAPAPTPAPSPATRPTTAPSPAPVPPPLPSPSPAGPRMGGILNYPRVLQPGGWDMHRKVSGSPFMTMLVFNNLVTTDPARKGLDPANIIGDLAEKWEVSPDGKTWTFYLRKGVKWHDGKPFTADDVVYSFEKMMDSKRSSVAALFPTLDKVTKADDFTVKITMKRPSPSFLVQLTGPYVAMQAKHTGNIDWKSTDFLMGTGPFKFSKMTTGVNMEFVKNPDYYKKGQPYLDGVTIYFVADRDAQTNAMVTGRLDMLSPAMGIMNKEQLDKFKTLAPKDAVTEWAKPYNGNIMFFNHNLEPLKNPKVRRAIQLVADRPQMVAASFGVPDWANTSTAFFTTIYGLPASEIVSITGSARPFDQRVAEAKQLMADAGYASGFKMKLVAQKVAEIQRRLIWLADQLRKINIDAQVFTGEQPEVAKLVISGDFGIIDQDSLATLGEPDEMKGYFMTGDPNNFMKYSNPKVDQLFEQQSQEMDLAKRKALTQEIERILLTDAAAIPVEMHTHGTAYLPYVKGFSVQDQVYGSAIMFEKVWLDKK